jgi:PmbA protein
VVERGILKRLTGGIRYADWLGEPRRGSFPLFSVSEGSIGLERLRAESHLEVAKFSDFRLEPTTGDFGGEIRLAYWFDGEKRVPLTGGSISGSVAELRAAMVRSRERSLGTRSLCPAAIKLRGVSITGAL